MERVMFLGIALALGIFAAPAVAGGRPGPSEDDPGDWPMYNRDPSGSRTNPHELTLGPRNVSKLRVIWRVPTPGAVVGTPAVVGDTIYAGDAQGNVFALDAATGRTRWATHLEGAVLTPSATVLRGRVVVGDQAAGFIFGLDQASGRVLWRIRPTRSGYRPSGGRGPRSATTSPSALPPTRNSTSTAATRRCMSSHRGGRCSCSTRRTAG